MGGNIVTTPYSGTFSDALQGSVINANDVLYLREGTYSGDYISYLIGSGLWPITVKAWPGERAIIDGSFKARGHNVIFQNLEFIYSGWSSRESAYSGSTPIDIPHTKALASEGMSLKFINCLIHDQSSPAFQMSSIGGCFYGCLIYHNGWSGTDRGHGHGLYLQNQSTLPKEVKDCFIFDNFGYGIHAYTEGGKIDFLTLEGNTCFRNGSLYGGGYNDILVGGYTIADSPILKANMTYNLGGVNLGYSAGCLNAVLIDNYFPQGITKTNAEIATETGNYYGPGLGNKYFLRQNEYDLNKANLTVYNDIQANTVSINVSGLNWTGLVHARNVQDYFSDIQSLSIVDGHISVNMQATNRTVSAPIQWTAPPSTFPKFGAFVLEHIG